MSELSSPETAGQQSRFRWRPWRILSSSLMLLLMGLMPIGVAVMLLDKTLRSDAAVQGGMLTELAFVIMIGAFGSMVVLLSLLPLRTWRINGDSIKVGWLGGFETSIDAANIRAFGKLLVSGSMKHGIRPYSILCFERSDGRIFDFSSRLFLNNDELEQFLESRGITRVDNLSSPLHLRIWVIHMLIMAACAIAVMLHRWLSA
jgi:hypothetical protein